MAAVGQSQDIIGRIKASYNDLSKSQQRVADFLLTHGIDVAQLSATQIAELVGVNASTVVRTAQTLGYDGFLELRNALQSQLLRRINSAERFRFGSQQLMQEMASQENEAEDHSILAHVVRNEIRNLQNILSQISTRQFEQAVELIDQAKVVYIVGMRISAPLASNLGFLLRYIRGDCVIMEPSINNSLADQLLNLTAEDMLFAISYSRYAEETLRCMDYARRMGAPVITLTDSEESPPAQRADLALVIPFRHWLYGNSVAPFALLNALFRALLLRHVDEVQGRLELLDSLYKQFQIFGD